MTDRLSLPLADDLHVHLRQGDRLRQVVPQVRAGGAGRVLAMPNLKPPLATAAAAAAYRDEIRRIDPALEVLATVYLTPALDAAEVRRCAERKIAAVKSYPKGATTNSEAGVESYEPWYPAFAAMQDDGIVLSLHGEVPPGQGGACVLDAEERFLGELERLHRAFPRLRIVLEHVTSAAAVACVQRLGDTVAATITAHHLELTVDDWAGKNHNFCKPVAKYPSDRAALRAVVAAAHPRFFLGSDSAPHPRHDKETACACAGVFTQPLLLPYLATTFDRLGMLDRLEAFACRFGAAFYRLPPMSQRITLVRRPQTVPASYGDVVPFRAGETLDWSIAAG